MKRRDLMKLIVQGMGAVTAGAVGIPALIFGVAPAFEKKQARWRPVGPLDGFPPGSLRMATVALPREDWAETPAEKGVFVWRPNEEDVIVYSRSCTDLGCPVHFDEGSDWFFCPCHGGIFDKEGAPVAGPPRVPLYRYAWRLREGILEIDLSSIPPMA